MKQFLIFTCIIICRAADEQVQIEITFKPENCSDKAADGSVIVVNFEGYLSNGTKFDSTADRHGGPATHAIGSEHVLPGWDQGVIGMCIGEKRRLVVPPSLAYGDRGIPGLVPGGETLTFDVELVDIIRPSSYAEMFTIMDTSKDRRISRDEMLTYMNDMLEKRRSQNPEGIKYEAIPNYDDTVDSMFKTEDLDGDGFLSEDEFLTARYGQRNQNKPTEPQQDQVHSEL